MNMFALFAVSEDTESASMFVCLRVIDHHQPHLKFNVQHSQIFLGNTAILLCPTRFLSRMPHYRDQPGSDIKIKILK